MVDTNYERRGETLKEAAPTKKPEAIQLLFASKTTTGDETGFADKLRNGSKIHTIRTDKERSIQAGVRLRLYSYLNQDTKRFIKPAICTGYQWVSLKTDGINVFVWVDNRQLTGPDLVQFYRNDGFDSFDSFAAFFMPVCQKEQAENGGRELKKKLVHWTDFRY